MKSGLAIVELCSPGNPTTQSSVPFVLDHLENLPICACDEHQHAVPCGGEWKVTARQQ